MPSIVINDEPLHYVDKGKGELVVLVHGTLSDYRAWNRQVDPFSAGYRVIAYSRRYAYPNRREFNLSRDYSPLIHSDDLAELIDAFQADKINLIGHSYGAYISLITALNNPSRIKTLVLCEPPIIPLLATIKGGKQYLDHFKNEVLVPAKQAFLEERNKKALGIFLAGVSGDGKILNNVSEEIIATWMENILELWGTTMNDVFKAIDLHDLQNLHLPVLLVNGEKSPPMFSLIIDKLDQYLPQSIIYTLPGSSHGLHYENPDDFNLRVLQHLDRH